MSITYEQFKQKYPMGSSIAKPFYPFDYKGECVSYVLTKAVEVDGAPFNAPIGSASQIPYNKTFLQYYEKVNSPVVGDLMFWGDDLGTWTGPDGHTAIYDGDGYMMNQNFSGSRVISRNKTFSPGFIGYFRKRGEDMATKEQLIVLYQLAFPNQEINYDWIAKFTGKDVSDALNDLRDDASRQRYITKVINNAAAYEKFGSSDPVKKLEQIKEIVKD